MSNAAKSTEDSKSVKSDKDEAPKSSVKSDGVPSQSQSSPPKTKLTKQTTSFGNVEPKANDKLATTTSKKKFVGKVVSWNRPAGGKALEDELCKSMDGINLSSEASEDNLCKPDWLRARDSLENLLVNRSGKSTCGEILNSKSAPLACKEKTTWNETSPHSEASLGTGKNSCTQSIAKVLNWDPWDKLGKKNKKENKRRKFEKTLQSSNDTSPQGPPDKDASRKDTTAGDEVRPNEEGNEEYVETYEYQPYRPKNSKSVEFTNEVQVIYFTGEEVVGEAKEPLKKELEQQIRNKEMRRGHCPAMLNTKRKQFEEDYMALWFKK